MFSSTSSRLRPCHIASLAVGLDIADAATGLVLINSPVIDGISAWVADEHQVRAWSMDDFLQVEETKCVTFDSVKMVEGRARRECYASQPIFISLVSI